MSFKTEIKLVVLVRRSIFPAVFVNIMCIWGFLPCVLLMEGERWHSVSLWLNVFLGCS